MPTAVSLFSGSGAMDLGFHRSGFRVLACVEKDFPCCQTLRYNLGEEGWTPLVLEGDVASETVSEWVREVALGDGGRPDLLFGGPPCQAFSSAGKRQSVKDPRGTLLWQFARYVRELRPKFFVFENVRGLMSAALRHRPIKDRPENGGPPLEPDERPGSVVEALLDELDGEYRIDAFEVNAVNYGVPQLRERALFIGNRFGLKVDFPVPTHGPGLIPYRTLREALDGLPKPDPAEVMDFSERKLTVLAQVPPGGNWRSLPSEVAKESMGGAYTAKGGRSGWWRRLNWDLPAPTVLTQPNHASTSLCHPEETRALSYRECARLQQFPDDWDFKGTLVQKYRQIGNAVPVGLAELAGRTVQDAVKNPVPAGDAPRFRQVYLNSHVRTRKWVKDGKGVVRE